MQNKTQIDTKYIHVYTFPMEIKTIGKIQKWGNSFGIRLPKDQVEQLNAIDPDKVEIIFDGKSFNIKPIKKQTLKELMDLVTPENTHPLVDWGPDVGQEIC